jgi:pimeloyl-ACP methyl ester carboxylesterase
VAAEQYWDIARLREEAALGSAQRRALGDDRLAELLDHAARRVPAYRGQDPGRVRELGLGAFPLLTKDELRSGVGRIAEGAVAQRWNRTSGSTNLPLRTALGNGHERNQIVRWIRHWADFGVVRPDELHFVVPRAYRLRLFGGGELVDLAGGHRVRQTHPGDSDPADVSGHLVVANPHVLDEVHPKGWKGTADVLVTSYEQRPPDIQRWSARVRGDVYGLSEVGDVAWQSVGDDSWQVHEDLVHCEILPTERRGDRWIGELVVTDLTNRTMPLLRYRTGDLVVGTVGPDGGVRTLESVVGRRIVSRGTALAGVDIMTALMPALLEAGSRFRVAASSDQVVVSVDADAGERRRLLARLSRQVPGVVVTDDESRLAGLTEVLRLPEIDPPAVGAPRLSAADCRCTARTRPEAVPATVCGSGAGRPRLLCLPPGPGFGHEILRSLHTVLAGIGKVDLVEYPGHGRVAVDGDPEPELDLDLDLERLLDQLCGLVTAEDVLLGHSWGADIALRTALRVRPRALVLLCPPPRGLPRRGWPEGGTGLAGMRRAVRGSEDWFREYLAEYAVPLGFGGDPEPARTLLAGVPTSEEAWRRLRRGGGPQPALCEEVAAVGVPTLVVTGDADPLVDRGAVASAAELPGVRHVSVPGSHYPYVDAAYELRAAVRSFIEECL